MKEKGKMLFPTAGLLCSGLGQMFLRCLLSLCSSFAYLHLLRWAVEKKFKHQTKLFLKRELAKGREGSGMLSFASSIKAGTIVCTVLSFA